MKEFPKFIFPRTSSMILGQLQRLLPNQARVRSAFTRQSSPSSNKLWPPVIRMWNPYPVIILRIDKNWVLVGGDFPAEPQVASAQYCCGHDARTYSEVTAPGCCQQPCWQRDLPVVRGGVNPVLGTCHTTAKTSAKLLKYLIPLFGSSLYVCVGWGCASVHLPQAVFALSIQRFICERYLLWEAIGKCQRVPSTRLLGVFSCRAGKASLCPWAALFLWGSGECNCRAAPCLSGSTWDAKGEQ